MNKGTEHKTVTFDEALKDPSLAHFHEAIEFVKEKSGKELFPKKYELGVMDSVLETVVELFDERPNMPLKSALTSVFQDLPDDLSTTLLLKVTNKVIQQWGKLTATSLKTNDTVAAH
jgi:hypothetical protein